jgi:MFS family permease
MREHARRNIRLLTWFNFCDDFRVYNAVAIVYFAAVTHSYALAALIFSLAKISSAVFEVPTGVLSDLVARKVTLLAGQVASTGAVLCYALGGSFTMLAAGAIFEGLAFSLFSGNNDALLYDTLKEEGIEADFVLYQGQVSSMFQFALAASAALATIVLWSAHLPLAALFWISVAPKFVGFTLGLFLIEPKRNFVIESNIYGHLRESVAAFVRDRRLRLLTIAYAISFGLGETKFLMLPGFYQAFWPAWALGIARGLAHVFAGVGFRLGGRIAKRFGEARVLLSAMPFSVTLGISSIIAANAASPLLYSLTSLPFGPATVASSALMQQAFTDRQRATIASLGAFAGNLFFAAAMFCLGSFADHAGLRYALLTAEILSIPTFFIYWRLFGPARTERKTVEDQAS